MDDAASRPSAAVASTNRSIDWRGTFVPPKVAHQAGSHLLVDFWDAERLSDAHGIGDILNAAATAAGATILHTHTHRFGIGGGVSGVVVLAESHITIHTWPEWKFAAIDLFMCGNCDPHRAIPVLRQFFRPGRLRVSEHRRGTLP